MISEAVDFKYLLLDYYQKLKLTEVDAFTILLIDHLVNEGNDFITPELLSLKMNLPIKEIDKILANLVSYGFIEYTSKGKKTITTIEPLKNKLIQEFENNLALQKVTNDEYKGACDELVSIFENNFNRSLSPLEKHKITEWLISGYDKKNISDALSEAVNNKNKSFNFINEILISWKKRGDIEKEGVTAVNKDWNKNLEETIRIAKTPWLDSDDED